MRASSGNYDALGLGRPRSRSREVSAAEVMEAAIERIETVNPKLNFISVRCYELGRSLAAGAIFRLGRSWACTFLLKDSFMDYAGTLSTQCCRMFKDYVSTFDMGDRDEREGSGLPAGWPRPRHPECGWGLADGIAALRRHAQTPGT